MCLNCWKRIAEAILVFLTSSLTVSAVYSQEPNRRSLNQRVVSVEQQQSLQQQWNQSAGNALNRLDSRLHEKEQRLDELQIQVKRSDLETQIRELRQQVGRLEQQNRELQSKPPIRNELLTQLESPKKLLTTHSSSADFWKSQRSESPRNNSEARDLTNTWVAACGTILKLEFQPTGVRISPTNRTSTQTKPCLLERVTDRDWSSLVGSFPYPMPSEVLPRRLVLQKLETNLAELTMIYQDSRLSDSTPFLTETFAISRIR